jgi:putative DNA primase/helicase
MCDWDLAQGDDLYLAQLLKRKCKDIVNVGGDNSHAKWYCFDPDTTLWKEVYPNHIATAVVPRLIPLIQGYVTHYDRVLKDLQVKEKTYKDGTVPDALAKSIKRCEDCIGSLNANILKLQGARKRHDVVSDLSAIMRDVEMAKRFNSNPDVISVKNGVIELRTKTLRPRVPEDYLTYALEYDYNPDHPDLPAIETFMTEFTLCDKLFRPEYKRFLKRVLGYSLTGRRVEEVLFFFLGTGANGKGVVMELMSQMLGEFLFCQVHKTVITKSQEGQAGGTSSHIMELENHRVGWVDEMPDVALDDYMVKVLTGGARVSGRNLHENQRSFINMCQLLVNSNGPPECKCDDAMMRRLIAMPCDMEARFDDPECDMPFDEKNPRHVKRDQGLKERLSVGAFMAWVVEGAFDWYENKGLGTVPKCCLLLKKQIQDENDLLADWLEERCERQVGAEVPVKVAKANYNQFRTEVRKAQAVSMNIMTQEMAKKKYKKTLVTGGACRNKTCFVGIKLKQSDK